MRIIFLTLFILVPLAELAILIKVGEVIGVLPTIALVIATAVIGVSLLKRQGLAALNKARATVEAGEFPVESVVDGACLLIAGAFLLTPGLLTDTAGFLLLVPALRHKIAHLLFSKFGRYANVRTSTFEAGSTARRDMDEAPEGRERYKGRVTVIEGEYESIDSEAGEKPDSGDVDRGSSPWRR